MGLRRFLGRNRAADGQGRAAVGRPDGQVDGLLLDRIPPKGNAGGVEEEGEKALGEDSF